MIQGLHELILYVQDMASQVKFYRDVLGLAVVYPAGLANYQNEYWVTLDAGNCLIALHGGGQRRLGQDNPKMVFKVANIEAARAELMSKGLPLSEVRSPAAGVFVCDGLDPEGVPISIESSQPN